MAAETVAPARETTGCVQPTVDVPSLQRLLDGRYPEVHDLVRTNLLANASILEEAQTLARAEEREKELLVELAATGQTGMGFSEECRGGDDIGASVAEHGQLLVARSKAISREVNDRCRKLPPLAVDLVDALGAPPEMLRSSDLVGG